jgi:hypothetical protein
MPVDPEAIAFLKPQSYIAATNFPFDENCTISHPLDIMATTKDVKKRYLNYPEPKQGSVHPYVNGVIHGLILSQARCTIQE